MKAALRVIMGCLGLFWGTQAFAAAAAIPIAKLERATPVDFAKEILPILRNNCLACHNQTKAKADLVLETPQTILKGSENGPVVVPGRSEASPLLKLAAHQATPTMPPRDNKVAASDLTPEQLGLLRLWIDQGAHGEAPRTEAVAWQPLPEAYQPTYAVAMSPDGQTAACSRANRIFLFHLPTGRVLTCLTDPHLPGPATETPFGFAHPDSIHALAFSPDGALLASGGYRQVKLWRRHKKPPTIQLGAVTNEITVVALSPDGRWLATGDPQGRLSVRGISTGKLLQTLGGYPARLGFLEFSPDGSRLLSASEDHIIRLWDLSTGGLSAAVRAASALTALTWLEGGHQFASATAGGSLQLWAIGCGGGEHAIVPAGEFHADGVLCLHAMPDCPEEVVSAGLEGVARVWDVRTGALVREMNHGAPIIGLAETASRLASLGLDNTAVLWNPNTGKELARLRGDHDTQEQVTKKERALRLATNEVAYARQVFDTTEKERKTQTDRVRKATEALTAAEKVTAEKRKKADEARAATTAAEKPVVALTEEIAKAKESYRAVESDVEQAHLDLIACLQALAQPSDSQRAATTSADAAAAAELAVAQLMAKARAAGEAKHQFDFLSAEKQARLKPAEEKLASARKQMEAAEGELNKAVQSQSNAENELTLSIAAAQRAAELASEARNAIPKAEAEVKRTQADLELAQRRAVQAQTPIYAAAFSADGLVLATGGEDRAIHIWSALTGEALHTLGDGQNALLALAFRSPREIVSANADGAAADWDLNADWTLESVIGSGDDASPLVDRVNALAFSPDGQTLAIGGGEPSRSGQILLWNPASRRVVRELNEVHSDTVFGLAFSRTGQFLASCAADRFMRVIDLGTGKVVRSFEGHTHHVLGVAWKDDGRTLATSGADNLVKIWDFRTGERRKNIDGFEKEVTSITAVLGEEFLVTSGDHQVRLLNEKGEALRAFDGAKDFLYSAAASADGKRVVAGGQGGIVYVWNGFTGELIAPLPLNDHPVLSASKE